MTAGDEALAIVIPAYKGRHLAATLESLAAQTDPRFRVYVADDGSPEALEPIVAAFRGRLDLVYRRFPENLGRVAIVRHWDRAIRLGDEPWVWLFSDDDRMSADCVAAWRAQLARAVEPMGLMRFDLVLIDEAGAVIRREPSFPARLDAVGYARRGLEQLGHACVIQNVIFRRAVYEAAGGFADLPGGYCTDVVSWAEFARTGGIRRVEGGSVEFRLHPGTLGFDLGMRWGRGGAAIGCYAAVIRRYRTLVGAEVAGSAAWRRSELRWFGHWFRYVEPLSAELLAEVARELASLWPDRPIARRVAFWKSYGAVIARAHPASAWLLRLRRKLLGGDRPGEIVYKTGGGSSS